MNQKLFKQIRNEWRSNLWLSIELLVVSVLLWYIADFCYVNFAVSSEPRGFDTDHCYLIELGYLEPTNPKFKQPTSDAELIKEKIDLIQRIRRRPEVEAAAYSMNSYPYNGSNSGTDVRVDTFRTSNFTIKRIVEPDFVKVFRYTGTNGETSEELAAMLEGNNVVVSENLFKMDYPDLDVRSLLGKNLYEGHDTVGYNKIVGIMKPVKYNDYMQGNMNRSILMPLPYGWTDFAQELTVRVRENMDKNFIENLTKDAENELGAGNYYIRRVVSFDRIRESHQSDEDKRVKMYLIGMGFLLMNIFLGLLGTFWFRTQQRVPDIAIRMVSGATRGNVFRLLTGEGLLLLTIVTPLAVLIDVNLAHFELNAWYWVDGYMSWGRVLTCAAIAYALMALMIVAGIAIPAYRAMHITPSTALRDE